MSKNETVSFIYSLLLLHAGPHCATQQKAGRKHPQGPERMATETDSRQFLFLQSQSGSVVATGNGKAIIAWRPGSTKVGACTTRSHTISKAQPFTVHPAAKRKREKL